MNITSQVKFIGFLMLPIYTRYLTPEDYGVAALLMLAIVITEVVVGMRMGQAIFRHYFLAKDQSEKKSVLSTAYFINFIREKSGESLRTIRAGEARSISRRQW